MRSTMIIKSLSDVFVGRVTEGLEQLLPRRRVVAIADANIDRLYPDLVHRFDHIIIGQGEANKNLDTVQHIYRQLMEMGADRSTMLLGIGGGITTDIAGFVAATYMRGLEYGIISTTLLGQVDASVGGKNGVNVADYKNMVGTFLQPRFVILDVEMLHTLPRRELRAGMAEVVKSAIIGDRELFDYIETHAANIYADSEALQEAVLRSIRLKLDIVERDERESGIRRVLNLGHTIGHAIEKCCRELNHGEGVAVGMSLMAQAAAKRGIMQSAEAERIDSLLTALGFTLTPPVAIAEIMREVRHDKKKHDNILRAVLPERIGKCRIEELTFDEFEQLFQ